MTKDLRVPIVKDLMRVIIIELTMKFDYFSDIEHFKIMTRIITDNIIPRHIKLPGISYNF